LFGSELVAFPKCFIW